MAKSNLGVVEPPGGHIVHEGRVVAALVEAGETGGIVVYSAYLVCGDEMGPQNWEILGSIARHVAGHGLPWVCAGDWNVPPQVLASSGWPGKLGASVIVPPVDHTTRAGDRAGRLLDFFVASKSLSGIGLEVGIDGRAPLRTHDAVRLLFPFAPRSFEVTHIIAPKTFPQTRPVGPRKQPEDAAGLRQATAAALEHACRGECNQAETMLNDATDWMMTMIEEELIHLYHLDEIGGEDAYRGRAGGHRFTRAPVLGPKHRGHPRGDPAARRLRMLQDRAADLHGALRRAAGKGRPTADLKERVCAAIDTATYIGADDTLPQVCGEVANAVKRVARRLENGIKKRPHIDTDQWVNPGHYSDLEEAQSRAAAAAEPAEQRHRSAISRGITEWCKEAQANGAGLAHRWTQVPTAWRPETVTVGSGMEVSVTANPDALVDEEADKWEPLWRPPAVTPKPIRWGKVEPLPRPTVRDVRRAARRFKARTKVGVEGLSPRDMAELTDEVVEAYIDVMLTCERLGKVPDRVATVVVMLLNKKLGGRRPIGILPTMYRLWAAVRKPLLHEWERQWARAFFAAARGKSAADATWHRALRAEHATLLGASAGSILWDLRKCFEHGDHSLLAAEAEALGFPMAMARLATDMYAAERRLCLDGAFSRPVRPTRGFVAGCAWAMACVKVTLLRRLDAFVLRHPHITFELYVDDAEVQAVGQGRSIARDLAAAAADLAKVLEDDAGYPLAGDKAAVIASEDAIATEVIRLTEGKAGKMVAVAEKLGIEYCAGKRRPRRGGPRRMRLVRQLARKKRLARFQKLGGCARVVVSRGVLPAAMYDGLVNGVSDAELYKLRGMLARATAPTARGSYTLLKLLLTEDPALRANADVIERWASAAWRAAGPREHRKQGDPTAAAMQSVMGAAIRDMSTSPGWDGARGPAGGVVRTAKRIGWTFSDAFHADDEKGEAIDFGSTDPRAVRELVRRATEDATAKQIAKHEKDPRLADGIWAQPVRSALRSKRMGPAAKASLRRTFTGGYWTGARRAAAGLTEHATCECGAPRDDTFHRLYECCRSQATRDELLSEDHLAMALRADRESPMWTRALARDPRRELPAAKRAHDEFWYFADDVDGDSRVLVGDIYVDGSALFPTNPVARRAGWSAVNLKPDGTVRAAVYGHVPAGISPGQTAAAGELHALRRAAELACGPVRILTDYQTAVEGSRRGVVATTGLRTASAASWRGFWRATDGEGLNVLKVEAHRTAKSAREDSSDADAMMKKFGNDAADAFAKRGAASHHTADELATLQDYVDGEAELRDLAVFIGSALANWPPAPRNTRASGDGGPRRRDAAVRRSRAAAQHGHRIAWGRNGWQCANCGKATHTLRGRRKLELEVCTGHTGARIERQGNDPSAHVLWAAESDTTDAAVGGADVVWCSRCGGYSSTKLYKLGGICPGVADPPARTRLMQLSRGRHPTLGYAITHPVRLTDDVIAQLRLAGDRQQADFANVLRGADRQGDEAQRQARPPNQTGNGQGGRAAGRSADGAHDGSGDEDVFGFGGGFDEDITHPSSSTSGNMRTRDHDLTGGTDDPGQDGLGGRRSDEQPCAGSEEASAARAQARSVAVRRRMDALTDRVKRRRMAAAAVHSTQHGDQAASLRTARAMDEGLDSRSHGGGAVCQQGRPRDAGDDDDGRPGGDYKRRRQVEATSAVSSAVVAREGPGSAELARATGTVAPHRAVATVPVAAREEAATLHIGRLGLAARSPDGGAAPSDDLEAGVVGPRGRESNPSHDMPAAEVGGRPTLRSLHPPLEKRRRRGAGPRIWEALCEEDGDTHPKVQREEAGGGNGPGDVSSVAHGGGVATGTIALDQPETGCYDYTRQGARHLGCGRSASSESQCAYDTATGARAPTGNTDHRPDAGQGGARGAERQQRAAGADHDGSPGHQAGHDEPPRPRQADAAGGGGGGTRSCSSRSGDGPPWPMQRDGATPEGRGCDGRRQDDRAVIIADVGSLRRSFEQPPRAARAALLRTLERPRKRARDDDGGIAGQLCHGRGRGLPCEARARIETVQSAAGGGPGVACEFGAPTARRRLSGKQPPPRTGVG